MTRRLLSATLPIAALATGAGRLFRRQRNPYYRGEPSDHFDGLKFFMPGLDTDKRFRDLLAWTLAGGKVPWPDAAPALADRPPARVDGLRVVLVGHASLLVQTAGLNLLVDPVWAERASPVPFAGPRRVTPPGIAFDDLPPIDAVLVTHNHYDHLCVATLGRLHARHRPRIIAPLGNDTIIRAAVPGAVAEAHDWHDRVTLSDHLAVTLEPARHWSARGLRDRRMALWCGFGLHGPAGFVYVAGDTSYDGGPLFRAIRDRHGPPRLAVLPIGAYEPRWFMATQHANPQDAVAILLDLGADRALGVHWGTFRLTDEGIDDPPRALIEALAAAGVDPARFTAMRPGEAFAG
jgi:L-ascorbate metabolism protein UlaG (beta-lactamase superfamily)